MRAAFPLVFVAGCGLAAGLGDYRIGEGASGGGPSDGGSTVSGMTGGGGGERLACTRDADCPDPAVACRAPACDDEGLCFLGNADADEPCDYAGGDVCDGEGNCVKEIGKPCSASSECLSDLCVDDVCCDSICDDACTDCALEGSVGSCRPAAPGVVDSACGVGVCDGAGNCASGGARWGRGYGDDGNQFVADVAGDVDGNVYMVGRMDGMVNFGGSTYDSDDADAFVVKLSGSGLHIFSAVWDNTGTERARAIAIDPNDGAMVIAGDYDGTTADFGAGPPLVNTGGLSMWLLRLDKDGNPLWQTGFFEATTGSQTIEDVAVGLNGDIWITGSMTGEMNFGNGVQSGNLTTRNVFVTRVSSSGLWEYSSVWGSNPALHIQGSAIAVDPTGNAIVAGELQGTVNFGAGDLVATGSTTDVFVFKLTPDGSATLWNDHFTGLTGSAEPTAVATDSAGNIIVGGRFGGSLDFKGMTEILTTTGTGDEDMFIAKLGPDGVALWSQDYGDSDDDEMRGVAVAPNDTIVAGGRFLGEINFAGMSYENPTEPNKYDVAVFKLASDGTHLWGRYFGLDEGQFIDAVAVTGLEGNIVFAGDQLGTMVIGTDQLDPMGGFDAYVGCLTP